MTTTEPPARERITGPHRDRPVRRQVRLAQEIDKQTAVGEIYMRALIRSQLRLGVEVVAVLALTLGALPLVFAAVPAVRHATFAGLPLPWLLLGFVVYPPLIALGWFYVRQAERNERDFTDLVDRP